MRPIEGAHTWVGELHAAAKGNLDSPQGFYETEAVRDLLSQLPEPVTVAAWPGVPPFENWYEVRWPNGINLVLHSESDQGFSLTLDGSRSSEHPNGPLFELSGRSDSADEHMNRATLHAPFRIPLKTGGTDEFAEGRWKVFYGGSPGEQPGQITSVQIQFDKATTDAKNRWINYTLPTPTGPDTEASNVVSSHMLVTGFDVWRILADCTDSDRFRMLLDHKRFAKSGPTHLDVAEIILNQQTQVADVPSVFNVEDAMIRVRLALEAALVE